MPTRVFVHVLQARSLPVMDRASGLCDAYVKPQLKGVVFEPAQTQIAKKTLNPVWNQDLRCDVSDDCLLQDEPLQLRVFDYDAFSADDQIGTVYVHCNSLYEDFDFDEEGQVGRNRIEKERDARQLHGWFPIYDTMRGLCGELQVTVYIQHIMDFNPVEDSSIGVQVLCSSMVPEGYVIRELLGLVDELLVEADPEHNWQDNFRSSRSSNEARQLLLLTMDGKLRRQIGRKVTDLGGNVVLAYQTNLDFEDDFIIARGHGTAARVELMVDYEDRDNSRDSPVGEAGEQEGMAASVSALASRVAKAVIPKSVSSVSSAAVSAVSSALSIPGSSSKVAPSPKGSPKVPTAADGSPQILPSFSLVADGTGSGSIESSAPVPKELSALPQNALRTLHRTNREDVRANLRMGEVQLLSLQSVPTGVLSSVGGMVAARSVKVIGQESREERVAGDRDAWWSEIREDIRAHARALDCSHVLGYTETTTIHEDVCVLSGAGTACVLDLSALAGNASQVSRLGRCSACHISYSHRSPPFSMRLVLCELCGKKYVPDLILSSIEIPSHIGIQGQGQLLEVHVCRSKSEKKKQDTEVNAGRVSELMPFLEFDLHKQILCKLKLRAHNAVWGLKMQLSMNDDSIVCIATGTSVLLGALPLPQPLTIAKLEPVLNPDGPDPLAPTPLLTELLRLSEANRQAALRHREDAEAEGVYDDDDNSSQSSNSSSDSENQLPSAYILEIDHQQELEDLVGLLQEPLQPMALEVAACTTERMPWGPPGSALTLAENVQFISCFKRISIPGGGRQLASNLWSLMQEMLGAMAFRLRNSGPALLSGVKVDIDLPDDNTLQLGLVAMAFTQSAEQRAESNSCPASPANSRLQLTAGAASSNTLPDKTGSAPASASKPKPTGFVELTGLGYVPGRRIIRHMDRVLVCMIREVLKANEEGNLSVWTSRLLLEAQALVRAQAKSLGADAVLHYTVQHMKIYNLTHKMRVYTLLVVSGDAVRLQDTRS